MWVDTDCPKISLCFIKSISVFSNNVIVSGKICVGTSIYGGYRCVVPLKIMSVINA